MRFFAAVSTAPAPVLAAAVFILASTAGATSDSGAGASCNSSPIPLETRAQVGEKLCATNLDQNDAQDPCNLASLYEEGTDFELVSGTAYGIAAAACAANCFALWDGGSACNIFTGFAAGSEALEAMLLWADGNEIVRDMMAKGALAGATTVATSLMAGGSKPAAEKKTNYPACALAAVNVAQSYGRFSSMSDFGDKAREAYAQKWCIVMHGLSPGNLQGGGMAAAGTNAGGAASGGTGDLLSRMASGSLTNAEAQSKVDSVFSKMDPRQKDFFSRSLRDAGIDGRKVMVDALTGRAPSPFAAAANALSGKFAANAKQGLKELESGGRKLAQQNKKDLDRLDHNRKFNESPAGFASTGAHGAASAPESNPLAGLGEIFSQLTSPGKKKAQDDSNVSQVQYASRSPAAARREGLHAPNDSIFEVIGSRYSSVTQRFLNGDDLAPASPRPPTTLPQNPYLAQ